MKKGILQKCRNSLRYGLDWVQNRRNNAVLQDFLGISPLGSQNAAPMQDFHVTCLTCLLSPALSPLCPALHAQKKPTIKLFGHQSCYFPALPALALLTASYAANKAGFPP
ncbi:MAG: hypothetical protein E6230_18695, partial [Paenibacillus dendritiformis]|nr:hypothetical protein [Paenibacillus dendritiformis]